MARSVNGELLSELPTVDAGSEHQVVSCYTCHRGMAKPPRNIRVELGSAMALEGLDGALARYRQLREQYFGSGRYDFSERSLFGMAQRLLESDSPEDALTVLEMGVEFYPESADLRAGMAMAWVAAGDLDEARAAIDAALALDPDSRMAAFAKQQLDDAAKKR